MEHHISFIILAIAMMLAVNYSAAVAMEEKSEFELPESGGVITFRHSEPRMTWGGLDPPTPAGKNWYNTAPAADRFEMGESGIMIDFGSRTAQAPVFGFFRTAPADRSAHGPAAASPPVLEAYELPESGRLIVFPRQVEMRRAHALQMQMPAHAVIHKD